MEDNNNGNIERAAIKKAHNDYQHHLEDDFKNFREGFYDIGKKALIIGGVFVFGFFVAKTLFFKSKKKKKKGILPINGFQEGKEMLEPVKYEYPSFKSIIKTQMAVFITNLLKKQLIRFLEEFNERYDKASYKENRG